MKLIISITMDGTVDMLISHDHNDLHVFAWLYLISVEVCDVSGFRPRSCLHCYPD